MKHDATVYDTVVSLFFTEELIKHIEEMMNTITGSSVNLSPETELTSRMINFAIQYNDLEIKQHYIQEQMEKIASIRDILEDKADKIKIEIAIKRLENSSPEFKKQFPSYKSTIERYKSLLEGND